MSYLEKFKKFTVVVADTGDFECNLNFEICDFYFSNDFQSFI